MPQTHKLTCKRALTEASFHCRHCARRRACSLRQANTACRQHPVRSELVQTCQCSQAADDFRSLSTARVALPRTQQYAPAAPAGLRPSLPREFQCHQSVSMTAEIDTTPRQEGRCRLQRQSPPAGCSGRCAEPTACKNHRLGSKGPSAPPCQLHTCSRVGQSSSSRHRTDKASSSLLSVP